MDPHALAGQLQMILQHFNKSIEWLTNDDADFAPGDGTYTAAQQVEHVARTVDWFIDGAFGKGWDMDFEGHEAEVRKVAGIAAAREHLESAFANAANVVGEATPEQLMSPLPEGEILGGAPRAVIVGGISEHTAHHRGALTVYARLCNKVAPMPYM